MINFILNLIMIITGSIFLGLSYLCKKKINKDDYYKFNLKWCFILGIISLVSGILGITNLKSISNFVYVILNIGYLIILGIFAYKTLKLLNTK